MIDLQHGKKIAQYLSLFGIAIFIVLGSLAGLRILEERFAIRCFNLSTTYACARAEMTRLTEQFSPPVALKRLAELHSWHRGVRGACHELAHAIGRSAASQYDTLGDAFARGDGTCWSGYYHGIVEIAFRGKNPEDVSLFEVESYCRPLYDPSHRTFDYLNCVHGLGHALMGISRNDLPYTLSICKQLSIAEDKTDCALGAFMENMGPTDGSWRHAIARYVSTKDPHYPCSEVDRDFQSVCYLTQTTSWIYAFPDEPLFAPHFRYCNELSGQARKNCYKSTGRDIVAAYPLNAEKQKSMCQRAPSNEDRNDCAYGAGMTLTLYYRHRKEADTLCQLFEGEERMSCREAADTFSAML